MRIIGLLCALVIGLLLYLQFFRPSGKTADGAEPKATLEQVNEKVDGLQLGIDEYSKRQQEALDSKTEEEADR